jgi:hypothetical protein
MVMYSFPINIDIPPFIQGVSPNSFNFHKRFHTASGILDLDKKFINPDLIKFFDDLNMVLVPELFYNDKNVESVIHVDRPKSQDYVVKDYVRFNWIFGGKDSTMNWYELLPETPWHDLHHKEQLLYLHNQLKLIHREPIVGVNVVQVGLAHNITNGPEPRYCLGLIPFIKDSNHRITMQEALDIFKDYR